MNNANKLLLLTMVSGGVYFTLCQNSTKAKQKSESNTTTPIIDSGITQPLRVVFFQDCSPSIQANGVEIIQSGIFTPYYNNIHRKIELNVGFICDTTAHKLISLVLLPAEFQRPIPVDMKDVPITRQRKLQMEYLASVRTYETDSAAFYADRAKRIDLFRQQIDTGLNSYRRKPSTYTDLIPIAAIADKVFNYSTADGAENFLIVNSDGIDSYHRVARPLKNKAVIILVNANGMVHTSLDSIVTNTLQSTEQAIQLSLLNSKKHS